MSFLGCPGVSGRPGHGPGRRSSSQSLLLVPAAPREQDRRRTGTACSLTVDSTTAKDLGHWQFSEEPGWKSGIFSNHDKRRKQLFLLNPPRLGDRDNRCLMRGTCGAQSLTSLPTVATASRPCVLPEGCVSHSPGPGVRLRGKQSVVRTGRVKFSPWLHHQPARASPGELVRAQAARPRPAVPVSVGLDRLLLICTGNELPGCHAGETQVRKREI